MISDFGDFARQGLVALAASAANMLCAAPTHAGEDTLGRFTTTNAPVVDTCSSSQPEPLSHADCAAAFVPKEPTPYATITIGRGVDLAGQKPVRYLASASLNESRGYIISSSGRLRDTVRLISPTPTIGAGDAPRGMPLRSSYLTSRFGMRRHPMLNQLRMHAGVDLGAAMGEPVHATSGGTVAAAGWQGGYGLAVRINHGKGIETRYAHLSRLNVQPGQSVKPGDVVGFVGSTGRSTGPHLHYEVRQNGRPVDPSSTLAK